MSGKPKNIIGNKYGKLIVESYSGNSKWQCLCECGKIVFVRTNSLTMGATTSCGCLQKQRAKEKSTKHGLSNHRLYKTWINMRSRCNNPNATKYELYGGKGIKVCEEWENDFISFYNWALNNNYSKNKSIDRIDGNKNYSPDNCRWATDKVQANNTTQVHNITFNGETMGIYAWADKLGISRKMLSERIRRGWTIERAFTEKDNKKGV